MGFDASSDGSRYDVFPSYSSVDHGVVEDIAQKLRDKGLEPFLDRWTLVPGVRWRPEANRLANSAVFGVCPWVCPSIIAPTAKRQLPDRRLAQSHQDLLQSMFHFIGQRLQFCGLYQDGIH